MEQVLTNSEQLSRSLYTVYRLREPPLIELTLRVVTSEHCVHSPNKRLKYLTLAGKT